MLGSKRMPVVDEIPERGTMIIGFYCDPDVIEIAIGERIQAVGHTSIFACLTHRCNDRAENVNDRYQA
ncbi:hypothetical protein Gaha_0033_002 [Novacetimonas hansenii JCM 7643]|nr:hypothetical protein Gaha_0033_002 [Novacetimonas hansenii JCM 7643]GBQ53964.1 hypothetical protein AA0243_0502 [Novacetimonas hansenii NRIC 0243]